MQETPNKHIIKRTLYISVLIIGVGLYYKAISYYCIDTWLGVILEYVGYITITFFLPFYFRWLGIFVSWIIVFMFSVCLRYIRIWGIPVDYVGPVGLIGCDGTDFFVLIFITIIYNTYLIPVNVLGFWMGKKFRKTAILLETLAGIRKV